MNKDKLGAFLFFIFSSAYTALSFGIEIPYEGEAFTSQTLPFALGILGIVVSLLMLLLPSPPQQQTVAEIFAGLEWRTVGLLSSSMIVYGLVITRLGFIISTLLFLNIGFWILGERRWRVMFYASVPLVLAFWLVLTKLLGIYLAPGSLFV